jgi:hypothetical protein
MATYSEEDFKCMAAAIGKDVTDVMRHESCFEAAAVWFRSDGRAPGSSDRIPPSKMNKKMAQIARDARNLLGHLEIHDPRGAEDGPGAIALLEYLASAHDNGEDAVKRATARVGRLVEVFEAIDAIRELKQRADKAAEDALQIGELIVPKGHRGNTAVNDWVAAMMDAYRKITGKEPGTSVGQVGRPNEGIASGPFIRFLQAAGRPLDLSYSEDAWRSRYRTALEAP